MLLDLYSPTGVYDNIFLANYATINLQYALTRISGISQVQIFGAGPYAMRIWVNPDKLANLQVTVSDITNAVKAQNKVNPAGQIGGEPVPEGQQFTYKVILIGESGVGKSKLFNRFLRDEYRPGSKPTIGVDFGSKQVVLKGQNVTAQIWDTAGQERFRALSAIYYHGAAGCIIVYDITSEESFTKVESQWLKEVTQYADQNIFMLLVGNKCDLKSQRQVDTQRAADFAQKYRMSFLETSALDSTNVEKAFDVLLDGIHERVASKMLQPSGGGASRTISTDGVVVHAAPNGPSQGGSGGGGCMSSC